MDALRCPITYELFRDPVVGDDGHTYEREIITLWLRQHETSPLTGQLMSVDTLRLNHVVKKAINEFTAISAQKHYQFILGEDVRIKNGRPRFQAFGKTIYDAEWMKGEGPQIILLKIDGARSCREASYYVKLSYHPHIVRTYGVVRSESTSVMLLQEFAEKTDLSQQLDACQFRPTPQVLNMIFQQTTSALICLADYGIVHGDVACRNVLVFRSHPTDVKQNLVKLTDFGLTRSSQLYSVIDNSISSTMTIIPTRYAAPEVLRTNGECASYSEKSDVYSFGVLMWEAYSNGALPYGSVTSEDDVRRHVLSKQFLPRPQQCGESMWQLMNECWDSETERRPLFKKLNEKLMNLYLEQNHSNNGVSITRVITYENIPEFAPTSVPAIIRTPPVPEMKVVRN